MPDNKILPTNDDFFLNRLIPTRYVLSILGCLGLGIAYGLKVNLSTAIIGMLNHTEIAAERENVHSNHLFSEQCNFEDATNNGTASQVQDGPFVWSSSVRGIILSSYFIGYLVAQIPAAQIAERFSAKWVMFFSVVINIIGTILTPISTKIHYSLLILMRILEGIGGGVTFPGMHVLLASWAPVEERSVHSSIVYAGTSLGTVSSILAAGYLTEHYGWESTFYWMGIACIPWCILWMWLIQDSPEQQTLITQKERDLIVNSLGSNSHKHANENRSIPLKAIFTSKPFLAILLSHICNNWGWYMILIELPLYVKQVLQFKIQDNSILTATPYLTLWLFSIGLSQTLDYFRSKSFINTTTARKISTLCCSIVPALCLFGLSYVGCSRQWAIIFMFIAVTFSGAMFSGFLSNHIDIAPNYAGTLVSLTNTVATIPGILVPIVIENLTDKNPTIESWRVIFGITIALYVIEAVFYAMFGSGEEQPWNRASNQVESVENGNECESESL